MTEQRCDTHPAVGFPEWGPIPELNKGAVEGGGGGGLPQGGGSHRVSPTLCFGNIPLPLKGGGFNAYITCKVPPLQCFFS